MITSRQLASAVAAVLAASTALAQDTTTRADSIGFSQRLSYGVAFAQSRPQGELARNIGLGYGVTGTLLMRLERAGIWSLRADIGSVQYGDASRDILLGDPATNGVRLEGSTTNYIMPASVGVQVARPAGLLRPYANAGFGLQAFFTETILTGDYSGTSIASTINQSDVVASASVGGGVYAPLSFRGKRLLVDVGAQYFDGGRVRYAPASRIKDSDGVASLAAIESNAHVLVVKIGATLQW